MEFWGRNDNDVESNDLTVLGSLLKSCLESRKGMLGME